MSTIVASVDMPLARPAFPRDQDSAIERAKELQTRRAHDQAVTQAQSVLLSAEYRLDADRQDNARGCVKQDRKAIDKASQSLLQARAGDLLSIVA